MKKLFGLCALLCAMVVSVSSCEGIGGGTPEITVTAQLNVEPAGGDYDVQYTITNPKDGGVISVTIPETNTWLTVKDAAKEGVITLTAAENYTEENRSDIVTLVYTYGKKSVQAVINIVQTNIPVKYQFTATAGRSTWYGEYAFNGLENYYILLTDNSNFQDYGEYATYYYIDIHAAGATEDHLPKAGTYSFDNQDDFLINPDFTYAYKMQGTYEEDMEFYLFFESGTVTIAREGNTYTIEAMLTDEMGEIHLVKYTGELVYQNGTINSTLTSDMNHTIDGSTGMGIAVNMGTANTGGLSNEWMIQFYAGDFSEVVMLMIYTDVNITELTGFESAVLTPNDNVTFAVNTFMPGASGNAGCWYLSMGEVNNGESAPFMDGTIEVVRNDDDTINFIVNSTDDNDSEPHSIKIVIENIPMMYMNEEDLEEEE